MIPQGFIQELLNRVDIVDVVGRHVKLKKTGKNLMACCPFHKEDTPSFCVTPSKQCYKCYGCGAFGNAIGFVMQYESLSYPEAIRRLAESLGMQVPEDEKVRRQFKKTRSLTSRMKEAMDFYRQELKDCTRAIEYLKKRSISGETAARFALGYSPDQWQGLEKVFGQHYTDKELEEPDGCGLLVVRDGHRYDRFRGRLMYPIRNPRGQVIGFGARTLNGDETPKYINSPETAIYHKGSEIYGLYEGMDALREKNRAIVAEGYMDVIQLSQAGFRESVAALGTAITPEHVKKLLKIVDSLYFCFDGDGAGQKALRRGMEAAIPVITDSQAVYFIVLPEEHDPDSLIKLEGAEAFERAIASAYTLSHYIVKLAADGKDLSSAEGRSQFLATARNFVVPMTNAPLLRSQIIGELAMRSRMSPDELSALFGLARPQPRAAERSNWKQRYAVQRERVWPVRKMATMRERILQNLLSFPELCEEFSGEIESEFVGVQDETSQRIVEVWRTATGGDTPVREPQILLELLSQSPSAALYRELVSDEFVVQTPIEAARVECDIAMKRLELELINEKLAAESQNPAPDVERLKVLYARQKVLKTIIDKIRVSFDLSYGR